MAPYPKGDIVVIDVETDGLDPFQGARIFCWAYVTNKGERGFMMKTPENLAWVERILMDPAKTIVNHNLKFDLKMFYFEGIDVRSMKASWHDTMIMAKVWNSMMFSYALVELGSKLLGRATEDKDAVPEWLKANTRWFQKEHGRKPNFSDCPIDIVKRRAIWDVETTLYLYVFLHRKVMAQSPELYETERQLMMVCIDMELTGIQVDLTHARKLRARALRGIGILQKRLNELVCPITVIRARCTTKGCKKRKQICVIRPGTPMPDKCPLCGNEELTTKEEVLEEFNANSSAIEMPLAFEKLGFELKYKTKPKKGKKGKKATGGGNWSFDEYAMIRYVSQPAASVIRDSSEEGWSFEKWWVTLNAEVVLNKLPEGELLPAMALKIRELEKMVSTYYDNIIEHATDVRVLPNGREVGVLHCSFNQSEAMTGRFSASEGIQTMPRILGPRECFVVRQGRRNWHFDYDQMEMRFFVHFAKDPKMAEAIENDIHLHVAAQIYSLAINAVSKEQRKRAKGVNFGILFGSGPGTMAETLTKKGLKTSKGEATILVANYHRKFPALRRIMNELKRELAVKGYLTNPFGRRYHIDLDFGYKGLNYMCQGTSADLMKRALLAIWKALRERKLKSRILMTVHDELGIEIPRSEEHVVVPLVMALMQDLTTFFIPITVDAEVVTHRWSQKVKPKDLGIDLKALCNPN